MTKVSLEYEVGPPEKQERIRIDVAAWGALPESVALSATEEAQLHRELLTGEGGLLGCLVCGHRELFNQRDFPRELGMAIVIAAAVLAPFTYYLSLGVAALLDCLIYQFAPSMVVCYACHARHRGFHPVPRHPRFDREIDERLKFGERAVMGKPMRPGGTADAPEPEH